MFCNKSTALDPPFNETGRPYGRLVFALLIFFLTVGPVQAAPYLPQEDGKVLERLPDSPLDPEVKAVKQLKLALAQDPKNLSLALSLARRYIEQGRAQSDPRYFGHAQGVLSPWWNEAAPPVEVTILRATIRQSLHDFDAALADLNRILTLNPQNAQARLTRAVIFQVKGELAAAKRDCLSLMGAADSLAWATCLGGTGASRDELKKGRDVLQPLLAESAQAIPQEKVWARTVLAEVALRLGEEKEAETHFKEALRITPRDPYLLGAFADLLLDQGRVAEVVDLLKNETKADALLLRLALAEKALKAAEFPLHQQWLSDRFAASRERGDQVHRREEARFRIHLTGEVTEGLRLARENWEVQREASDLRILLEAAREGRDDFLLKMGIAWMNKVGFEDARLNTLARL